MSTPGPYRPDQGRRGRRSQSLWKRFEERHPNLALPLKGAGVAAGTWLVDAIKSPLNDLIKDRVAEWTSHIAVVGPYVSERLGDSAAQTATALAVGTVTSGYLMWKRHQRRESGEPEPESDKDRIERIDDTATKAQQQAARANTRGDVAERRIGDLEQSVSSLEAGAQANPTQQEMNELRQTVAALQTQIRTLNDRMHSMTLDMGTVYHQQQLVQQQANLAEQRAGTAEARAVLAQNEVTDVQAHQLLQDGRLDRHDEQLTRAHQPAPAPQPGDPTYLPPDDAARLRAANARAHRQREQSRQPPPSGTTPPSPSLRPSGPQPPPPGPSSPTR